MINRTTLDIIANIIMFPVRLPLLFLNWLGEKGGVAVDKMDAKASRIINNILAKKG